MSNSSWAPLQAEHLQQLLDILHICHMWEIVPGIEFASRQLKEQFSNQLTPARSLSLARQYNLTGWIDGAVRQLISRPLSVRTFLISFLLYSHILF